MFVSTYAHRLSCPYGDVQIKDLYKQKDSENQSAHVDVLEVSKDTNTIRSRNEPEIVLTDSPKRGPIHGNKSALMNSTFHPPPIPMETESITVMASSDPSEVGQANLRTLLKPDTKLPYSDISDGSDTENNATRQAKQMAKDSKGASESHPIMPSMNGFYPYKNKTSSKGKESLSNISARLPSFGDVGRPKGSKKNEKKPIQTDEYIPDSQPSSPRTGKQSSNPADEVRSKLLSTYPGSSTSAIPVSMPEQDQRHTRVGMAMYSNAVSKMPKGGHDESSHSALHTLSAVAASLLPNDKPAKHPKMTMLTQDDFNKPETRVKRSVSPRPSSLVPKTGNRRSPSPARYSKQILEQQAATLPSFDTAPGKRSSDGGLAASPPVIVKSGSNICEWGPVEALRDEDGHDSDSSGSGSILHAKPHRNKHGVQNLLGDIKTDKPSREDTGVSLRINYYGYCYVYGVVCTCTVYKPLATPFAR